MNAVISSFITFPNIAWWASIIDRKILVFDKAEHFQKMTYRNRYYISGANGMIQLSIPLVSGRNQRTPMNEVQICNKDKWQVQHWRTLVSVYKRSPYFDFYEPELATLFEQQFNLLADFNLASYQWLKKQLGISIDEQFADEYVKEFDGIDLRTMKPDIEKKANASFPHYYQVFEERTGFLANLSVLDLLFSEGPHASKWIADRRDEIINLVT